MTLSLIKDFEFKKKLTVNYTKIINYSLFKSANLFDSQNDDILYGGRLTGGKRFVVVDDYIFEHNKNKIINYFKDRNIQAKIFSFCGAEENKNFTSFFEILKSLNDFQIDRRSEPIIAIGGGVTTDIAGFVASVYRRGVPHIKIPTTLMCYVDASVGIKTGINYEDGKNRIGTFEPPVAVILDKTFLKTLSKRHIVNGLGEIIKLGVVNDIRILELLEKNGESAIKSGFQKDSDEILDISIVTMINELKPNLFEENLTRSVDFGHTFSPALEMSALGNILHGEAVSIDVALSILIARERGLVNESEFLRVIKIMKKLTLPYKHELLNVDILWEGILERTYHRDGLQRIPLPNGLGQCLFINDLTKKEINRACILIREV